MGCDHEGETFQGDKLTKAMEKFTKSNLSIPNGHRKIDDKQVYDFDYQKKYYK